MFSRLSMRVHLLMFLCAVLVSGSFPVGAAITPDLAPGPLSLIRFFCASLIFLPFVWFRYPLAVSWRALLRYSLISAALVIFFWCMFLSLRYTTALSTSAIFTLVPALSALYAMVLNKERLGRRRLAALFLGVPGAAWIVFGGDWQVFTSLAWNRGDVIFFAGCLCMGLYTPLIRLLHRGEPMAVMAFWVMVTGTCWLLPLAGADLFTLVWSEIPLRVWLGIAYLSVFSTIISFFITQYAILFLGPTRVMAYSYLYPALVLLIDLLSGGSWPGVKVLPGICIVLLAMLVVQRVQSLPVAADE